MSTSNEFNTPLSKLMQGLKKHAGAKSVTQNYKGTGSQSYRRQLWVSFVDGSCIDVWLNESSAQLGGVVTRNSNAAHAPLETRHVSYEGRTPEQVYKEVSRILAAWVSATCQLHEDCKAHPSIGAACLHA